MLCLTGIIIIPALLFNPSTTLRVFQFLFFWLLAWLFGKKNNPLVTLILFMFITAFNLVIPFGRVLFSIGIFKITSGALETGIHRAATLLGLVMLSRFTIRRDLKIPGAFGELLGETFGILALLTEKKLRVGNWRNLIGDIDRLMLDLSKDVTETGSPAPAIAESRCGGSRRKTAGLVILAIITILSWLPMAFDIAHNSKFI